MLKAEIVSKATIRQPPASQTSAKAKTFSGQTVPNQRRERRCRRSLPTYAQIEGKKNKRKFYGQKLPQAHNAARRHMGLQKQFGLRPFQAFI